MTASIRHTERNPFDSHHRRQSREPGFTLIELMVALAVGAIAITSVYAIGAASARQFREQQRVSRVQTSLRMVINQIKRDVGRIGYHATPNITRAGETCMITNPVVPITLNEDADIGLVASSDFAPGLLHADRMVVMGNYATRSEYLLDGLVDMGASQAAFLQTEWQAFRRDFMQRSYWGQTFDDMSMLNTVAFDSAFRPNRWMRLQNRDGHKFFVTITGTASDQGRPQINFDNPTLPIGNACVGGNMSGGKAAPLSTIRYRLFDDTNDPEGTPQDDPDLYGDNIQLLREEVLPGDNNTLLSAGDTELQNRSRRVLVEYVVSFNISAVMDANAGLATQPCMWLYDNGGNTSNTCGISGAVNFANVANQVRTLIIDLSVRTPRPDINFPWPLGPNEQFNRLPINRYRPPRFIEENRYETSRVRSLRAEIFVSNLI